MDDWHHAYLDNRDPSHATHEHEIDLITSDGLRRKGIFKVAENAKGSIVLCHPAAYHKEFMTAYNDILFEDFHTIRFDFRRHGQDADDQYTTMGKKEANEVRSAVHFLRSDERTKNLPIFGFGISMGAAALVEAQSKTPLFDGLILQSMFDALGNQFKRLSSFYRMFPLLIFRQPTTFLARSQYRWDLCKVKPVKQLPQVDIPICLIHAQNDHFIPFDNFRRLYKSAKKHISHVWTPSQGKHTEILKNDAITYKETCQNFLKSVYDRLGV